MLQGVIILLGLVVVSQRVNGCLKGRNEVSSSSSPPAEKGGQASGVAEQFDGDEDDDEEWWDDEGDDEDNRVTGEASARDRRNIVSDHGSMVKERSASSRGSRNRRASLKTSIEQLVAAVQGTRRGGDDASKGEGVEVRAVRVGVSEKGELGTRVADTKRVAVPKDLWAVSSGGGAWTTGTCKITPGRLAKLIEKNKKVALPQGLGRENVSDFVEGASAHDILSFYFMMAAKSLFSGGELDREGTAFLQVVHHHLGHLLKDPMYFHKIGGGKKNKEAKLVVPLSQYFAHMAEGISVKKFFKDVCFGNDKGNGLDAVKTLIRTKRTPQEPPFQLMVYFNRPERYVEVQFELADPRIQITEPRTDHERMLRDVRALPKECLFASEPDFQNALACIDGMHERGIDAHVIADEGDKQFLEGKVRNVIEFSEDTAQLESQHSSFVEIVQRERRALASLEESYSEISASGISGDEAAEEVEAIRKLAFSITPRLASLEAAASKTYIKLMLEEVLRYQEEADGNRSLSQLLDSYRWASSGKNVETALLLNRIETSLDAENEIKADENTVKILIESLEPFRKMYGQRLAPLHSQLKTIRDRMRKGDITGASVEIQKVRDFLEQDTLAQSGRSQTTSQLDAKAQGVHQLLDELNPLLSKSNTSADPSAQFEDLRKGYEILNRAVRDTRTVYYGDAIVAAPRIARLLGNYEGGAPHVKSQGAKGAGYETVAVKGNRGIWRVEDDGKIEEAKTGGDEMQTSEETAKTVKKKKKDREEKKKEKAKKDGEEEKKKGKAEKKSETEKGKKEKKEKAAKTEKKEKAAKTEKKEKAAKKIKTTEKTEKKTKKEKKKEKAKEDRETERPALTSSTEKFWTLKKDKSASDSVRLDNDDDVVVLSMRRRSSSWFEGCGSDRGGNQIRRDGDANSSQWAVSGNGPEGGKCLSNIAPLKTEPIKLAHSVGLSAAASDNGGKKAEYNATPGSEISAVASRTPKIPSDLNTDFGQGAGMDGTWQSIRPLKSREDEEAKTEQRNSRSTVRSEEASEAARAPPHRSEETLPADKPVAHFADAALVVESTPRRGISISPSDSDRKPAVHGRSPSKAGSGAKRKDLSVSRKNPVGAGETAEADYSTPVGDQMNGLSTLPVASPCLNSGSPTRVSCESFSRTAASTSGKPHSERTASETSAAERTPSGTVRRTTDPIVGVPELPSSNNKELETTERRPNDVKNPATWTRATKLTSPTPHTYVAEHLRLPRVSILTMPKQLIRDHAPPIVRYDIAGRSPRRHHSRGKDSRASMHRRLPRTAIHKESPIAQLKRNISPPVRSPAGISDRNKEVRMEIGETRGNEETPRPHRLAGLHLQADGETKDRQGAVSRWRVTRAPGDRRSEVRPASGPPTVRDTSYGRSLSPVRDIRHEWFSHHQQTVDPASYPPRESQPGLVRNSSPVRLQASSTFQGPTKIQIVRKRRSETLV